jgi:hypothetical protein
MAQTNRTFRIFVSSTFSDLKEERNALHKEVFPELRRLCAENGARFQAIDLRWGVPPRVAATELRHPARRPIWLAAVASGDSGG